MVLQSEIEFFGIVEILKSLDQDIDLVDGFEQGDVEAQRIAFLRSGVSARPKKSGSAPRSWRCRDEALLRVWTDTVSHALQ